MGISNLNFKSVGDPFSTAQQRKQNPWSSRGEGLQKGWSSKDLRHSYQPRLVHDEVPRNAMSQVDTFENLRDLTSFTLKQRSGSLSHTMNKVRSLRSLSPPLDFWTARRSGHRSPSVCSDSSSKNSSLRGLDVMDSSYQSHNVENPRKDIFTVPYSPKRGLFPAPIDWAPLDSRREEFSFHCEICGELIEVHRRRDWQ